MKFLIAFVMSFLMSAMCFAQSASPVPVNPDDAGSLLNALMGALAANSKVGMIAAGVLLVVFMFKKYALPKLNLGDGVVPWLAIVLGILVAIGSSVLGGMLPADAVKIALFSGPGAIALWESVFKLLAPKS